ncbi:MAG: ATP synthase F1 subunit gamma [Alphaproteobacteria bacterium]|nr:ATP synthase F1 subunit gamma [Alphaproteobacteria bacterium]
MAGLKELRLRISSISSTQKIASAMKMVAAARLKRAQDLLQKSKSYHQNFMQIAWRLLEEMKQDVDDGKVVYFLPPLMKEQKTEDGKTYLLIVFSSDKGLCGSYNSNVLKETVARINSLSESGCKVKVLALGRKVGEAIKRRYSEIEVELVDGFAAKGADYQEGCETVKREGQGFGREFDVSEVVYTESRSAIKREAVVEQFLPFEIEQPQEPVEILVDNAFYDYKGGKQKILWDIVPILVTDSLFQKLLNSQTSEHGARMTSMDNATRNANDMISKLTLKYNRLRQSAITTELIEIISGAEAL